MLYLLLLLAVPCFSFDGIYTIACTYYFCNYFTYCSFWCIKCICVFKLKFAYELHTLFSHFFLIAKRMTYWGEIMRKGAEMKEPRGNLWHENHFIKARGRCASQKTHKLEWKMRFLLCSCFQRSLKCLWTITNDSALFDLRAMSKSSFPSIASLSLSLGFLLPTKCAYYAELFLSVSCFLRRDFCLFHEFCLYTEKASIKNWEKKGRKQFFVFKDTIFF